MTWQARTAPTPGTCMRVAGQANELPCGALDLMQGVPMPACIERDWPGRRRGEVPLRPAAKA